MYMCVCVYCVSVCVCVCVCAILCNPLTLAKSREKRSRFARWAASLVCSTDLMFMTCSSSASSRALRSGVSRRVNQIVCSDLQTMSCVCLRGLGWGILRSTGVIEMKRGRKNKKQTKQHNRTKIRDDSTKLAKKCAAHLDFIVLHARQNGKANLRHLGKLRVANAQIAEQRDDALAHNHACILRGSKFLGKKKK